MWNLDGCAVAITGAGSGIGRELALAFARRGCRLALNDRDVARLAETQAFLPTDPELVFASAFDVTEAGRLEAFAAEAAEVFGGVDVVVNNAGVALGPVAAHETSDEDFRWVMEINLFAVVNGTRAFMPHLLRSPRSALVNVSSLFGLVGMLGNGAYCASKWAVRGFTETLRIELEETHPHVLVTCVHPGGVKTQIARDSKRVDGVADARHERLTARFERHAMRTEPHVAAEAIVRGLEARRNRILIGADAYGADALNRLLPQRYGAVVRGLGKLTGMEIGDGVS